MKKRFELRTLWNNLWTTEKRSYNPEEYHFDFAGDFQSDVEKALEVNTVHACVNLIASSIARFPLKLYKKTKDGREPATEHPLYNIFKDPNVDMTGVTFINALVTNLLLYGNAYIEKIPVKGDMQLNVVPSKYVNIKIENNKPFFIVNVCDPNTIVKKKGKRLDSTGIIHVVGESVDGIHGISPVKKLSKTIEFAKILELFGVLFFQNGAQPSATITVPDGKKLSDEAIARLQSVFKAQHQGVKNAGRVVVLENGARLESFQLGNDASQYLQTKESLVEEIARIFNVPLHLIQKTDKATSWGTGIEQMGINFVVYTLGSHLSRIQSAVNRGLLTPEESEMYYFEFDTNVLTQGDIKGRYEAYEIGLRCGFISPNEIRQKENMPQIPGGNLYCMQLNQPPYAGEDVQQYIDLTKKENGENNG